MSEEGGIGRWRPWLSPLLLSFIALTALLEVLGPRAFSFRDETFCFHQAFIFRNSGPLSLAWGDGNMLKFLQYASFTLSGWWRAMHLPVLLAVGAQGWALHAIGCRLGGPRVAQGALLAALVSATALLQARSLLPFAILPALLAVSVALILRGGWTSLIGGGLVACGFLDYEATVFALPGVTALWLFEPRLKRRDALLAAAGLVLGLLGVLWSCRASLQEWWLYRLAYNHPLGSPSGPAYLSRVWAWVWGGDPEAYLGVIGHGSFPLWALPLAFLGLALTARRRAWLPLWIAGGLLALLPGAAKLEPQRAFSILIPLSLAAGFGWRWLWQRARARAWLAGTLLALPALGLFVEQRAFERSMLLGQAQYSRSEAWLRLGHDPAFAGQIDAALMPVGFAWETLSGSPKDPARAPWVWVPSDLAQDLPLQKGEPQALHDAQGLFTGDLLLALPLTDPLRQDLAALRPFWGRYPRLQRPLITAYRKALTEDLVRTPIAKAVLWKFLFEAAVRIDQLTVADLLRLEKEPFRSAGLYRAMMIPCWPKDLRLTYWLCAQMRKNCGAEKLQEAERGLLARPWAELPRAPGAPDWPEPGRPSLGHR